MATIIPISCKSGVVIFGTAHVYGEPWSADLQIENDRLKHFEMTANANSLTWAGTITGFTTGTGSVRAIFDNTPGSRLPSDKSIWMDRTGTGWLGYSSTVGFRDYIHDYEYQTGIGYERAQIDVFRHRLQHQRLCLLSSGAG